MKERYRDEEGQIEKAYLDEDLDFQQIYNKIKKRKKKHYFFKFCLFVCFCCLVIIGLSGDYFSIKKIQVEGNSYYTADEVIAMANAKKGNNLIFHPQKKEIKKRLTANPYFEDVKVRRKLPDTLIIDVKERKQAAAIVYGTQYLVIDKEGYILRKTSVLPKLTLIDGFTIEKLNVGEQIDVKESRSLKTTLNLIKEADKGKMFFKKINFSKVVIKAYIYDQMIVKGSPDQILKALENKSIQKVVANLFEEEISRGIINVGGDGYISYSPDVS